MVAPKTPSSRFSAGGEEPFPFTAYPQRVRQTTPGLVSWPVPAPFDPPPWRGRPCGSGSTQLPEDTWDYDKTGAKEPPYNLDALCLFLEINTWHYRCVKAKAISTAGLGYDFVVPEGVKEPDPAHKRVLQEFFGHPNDEMMWGEILEIVLTDFEALGNGYFEVVRNGFGTGRPLAIYHVPAVTMRVRKDKKGFIQEVRKCRKCRLG